MEKNFLNKKIVIFIIALIGLCTTVKLAAIYYDANFNPYALPSFCSVNDFIDCDGIARTTESQFFGVPLAYWGMLFYFFVIILLFADKLKNIVIFKFLEVFKNPMDYIAILGVFSFAISMLLLGLSLVEIKKLCVLCAFTYILNLLIGLFAIDYKNGGLVKAFKQSVEDFKDAVKKKVYLIALVVVALIASGFLSYTSATNVFAPQIKRMKQRKELIEMLNMKATDYAVSGNILGDKDAPIKVYVYTDYNCPFCGAFDAMFHKAAAELKGFEVIHKHLPLDTECNKFLRQPLHEGSCLMARYAMAAQTQGKFWEIDTKFFDSHPATEAEILDIARELGLDTEKLQKEANSDETKAALEQEIKEAYAQNINGTPAMKLGEKVVIGIRPYEELKQMLEEAGAKKRK